MSYFCPQCRASVPDKKRCEHWSLDLALASYSCSCGREGLAPDWDWHCTDCHRDFPNESAFFGDEHRRVHRLPVEAASA